MKKLILVFFIVLTSCMQEVIEPLPPVSSNIFSQKENTVADKDQIMFVLESEGIYFLSLIDISTNQVITKEKIFGTKGVNKINIYNKSIESRYLYLVLMSSNRVELNRTKLFFK